MFGINLMTYIGIRVRWLILYSLQGFALGGYRLAVGRQLVVNVVGCESGVPLITVRSSPVVLPMVLP